MHVALHWITLDVVLVHILCHSQHGLGMVGRDYMARGKPKTGFLGLQYLFWIAFSCSLGHPNKNMLCSPLQNWWPRIAPDVGRVGIWVFWIPSELTVNHFSNMWKNSCVHISHKYELLIICCNLQEVQGRSLNLNWLGATKSTAINQNCC